MTLDRLLKKAEEKILRELEISTMMKRVRDTHNLVLSYEKMEVFKGLKKKYKNHYINVLNVSMDTEASIIEENQKPLDPGEIPYQRKRPKVYREGPDGLIRGQMHFEPYDLHKDTVATIAKTVWKKLKQDDNLVKKVEANLMREKNIEMMKYPRGDIY